MTRVLFVLASAVFWLACGPNQGARLPVSLAAVDAPYELELDDDLDLQRKWYTTLQSLAPGETRERLRLRTVLSREYARRLDAALKAGEANGAFVFFGELLSLWTAEELDSSAFSNSELASFAPQARAILRRFARSGGDMEAVTALVALTVMEPANRAAHLKEVEEIFAYGDELAVSAYGAGAVRARPIEALELVVRVFPTRWAVDRLIALYRERQVAITSAIRRKGADMDLLHVHGTGVLSTARNIVSILAETGRIDEAPAAISELSGIGDDTTLRQHLETALSSNQAPAWILLASVFRGGDGSQLAALKLCQEAIRRDPKDALGYIAAGETAIELENLMLAIRYLEAGLRLDGDDPDASATLASLYEAKVNELAYTDRPNAALAQLKVFETFHETASRRFGKPLEPDLASAYAVMGRGLVSLGDLDAARLYLNRSSKLRPNLRALENLGTIELRQEHFAQASRYYQRALDLEPQTLDDNFERTGILRLSAEALAGAGKREDARSVFKQSVTAWAQLLTEYELAPAHVAQALIEMGKSHYQLGQPEEALEYFFRALNQKSDDHAHHADLVCFLLVRGAYDDAHDIYLDAMGKAEVSEYYKIYMSIWLLGENKRLGNEPDPIAQQYLRTRSGKLWTQKLARYAAGEVDRRELERLVTTRGQRAELMYYAAVIGTESENPVASQQLLEEVVKGSMVLFFEYELAKQRLRQLQ